MGGDTVSGYLGDCCLPIAPPGFEPGIFAFKERDVAVTPQGIGCQSRI
jgi:hypothetical protein